MRDGGLTVEVIRSVTKDGGPRELWATSFNVISGIHPCTSVFSLIRDGPFIFVVECWTEPLPANHLQPSDGSNTLPATPAACESSSCWCS